MGLNRKKQVEGRKVRPGREEKSIFIKLVSGVSNQNRGNYGKWYRTHALDRGKGARVFRGIYTPNPAGYYGGEWY